MCILKSDPCNLVKDAEITIKILRDNGLLLIDNDPKFIKVIEGDEIKIKSAKYPAKFIIVNN